ncbi:MAG: RHS repeat-associated core domain-containing protein [Candidatus Competibacteraceae bacterium]|nr:RHS repeat-associated core domain-containing protein [Candidatus Competibacteraceae bacterium]
MTSDPSAMRRYTQQYTYDEVGNILTMQHIPASGSGWTRYYVYDEDGNRLEETSAPGDDPEGPYSHSYTYDAHGNMTAMPHLSSMVWNHDDELQEVTVGSETVYFQYAAASAAAICREDGDDDRRAHLPRLVRDLPQAHQRRHRHRAGVAAHQRRHGEDLHHRDQYDRRRLGREHACGDLAVPAEQPPRLRGRRGRRERECHLVRGVSPYGTSAYRAVDSSIDVSAKRYRYTGMERDEETSLEYHSARYYAPWLGCWTASDPSGIKGGLNLFHFAGSAPSVHTDINGCAPPKSDEGQPQKSNEGLPILEEMIDGHPHYNEDYIAPNGDQRDSSENHASPTSYDEPKPSAKAKLEELAVTARAGVESALESVGEAVGGRVGPSVQRAGEIAGALAKAWGGGEHDYRKSSGAVTGMDNGDVVVNVENEDYVSSDIGEWIQVDDAPGLKMNPTKRGKQYAREQVRSSLEAVAREWNKRHPDMPIRVGEISKKGGGVLPPHRSHQRGVDIDVGVMPSDPKSKKKPKYDDKEPQNYSRELTEELIDVFRTHSTLDIEEIFFADPEVKGVTLIEDDHKKHFHVRYKLRGLKRHEDRERSRIHPYTRRRLSPRGAANYWREFLDQSVCTEPWP